MITITADCTGCGICVKACPFGAVKVVEKKAVVQENCTLCGACAQVCKVSAIVISRPSTKEIDLTQYSGVWVFAEIKDNAIRPVTFELLTKAKELAAQLNQEVAAVIIGKDLHNFYNELAAYGAAKIYSADDKNLAVYSTDIYSAIITGLIANYKPNIMLYPATRLGRDLAPRIAAALSLGLTADCTGLSIQNNLLLQSRPAFGGNVMADIVCPFTRPQLATVRPNVLKKAPPDYTRKAQVIQVPVSVDTAAARVVIKEILKTTVSEAKPLDEAEVIVAGGRGVGSKENFSSLEALAAVLNGAVGASRVAVELGWMPKSQQVGQSGITVSPKLYIACGISGAIQHLVGMKNADVIVAINKDPEAPIFNVATYGLVGDLHQIVPLLTENIKNILKKS